MTFNQHLIRADKATDEVYLGALWDEFRREKQWKEYQFTFAKEHFRALAAEIASTRCMKLEDVYFYVFGE